MGGIEQYMCYVHIMFFKILPINRYWTVKIQQKFDVTGSKILYMYTKYVHCRQGQLVSVQ